MSDRVKIHVVPVGHWDGHPAGEQDYGMDDLAAIVERANAVVSANGNPIQIDYEHMSLNPPADGAPAAGWMYSFTLENDGVYAEVEWTPKANERIKNGEYKFISPVIATNLKDPVTGDVIPIELFNAALTNQPFMHDSIKQVVANAMAKFEGASWFTNSRQSTLIQNKETSMAPEEVIPKMAGALGMPETTTAEELEALLKAVKQYMAAVPGAPQGGGMPTPEALPEMEAEMKQMQNSHKLVRDIAQELGVDADKILPKVAALKTTTDNRSDLQKEVDELKAFKAKTEIDTLIASNHNRIPPAKRDHVRAFANKHGIEAAREYVAELPEIAGNPEPKTAENKASSTDPDIVKMNRVLGLSDEDVQKYQRKEA